MTDIKIRREWLDVFSEGWHSVPEGEPGDRRRAGLAAVLPLILAADRYERPGLFDVSQGTCGHVWRRGESAVDGCPVCFDLDQLRATIASLRDEVERLQG